VVDLRLIADERDNNTVIADGLADLIARRFELPMDAVRLPIAVAIEIADGILDLAFRRALFPTETVIAEARSVVRAYLSGRLNRDLP